MSFLVRRISKAKWPTNATIADVPVTTLFVDMKTNDNTLSTWEIQSIDTLDEAVLALIANQDNIEKIDVVSIDREHVEAAGLRIVHKDGDTVVQDLVNTHKDIAELTIATIGTFSELILKALPINYKRYRKARLLEILGKAIEDNRLNVNDLKDEDVKAQLINSLPSHQ